MECHLRREKQLLLAGLAGLEGARVLWAGAQQPSWVSKVAGTGGCQRHLLAVGICQWLWLCPVPLWPPPLRSHIWSWLLPEALTAVQRTPVLCWLCCLHTSNPIIGFLVPYTQSSSSLPSPPNLHIIRPPCSSHCLLLFFLSDPSFFPFSLSLAPVSSYALRQLQFLLSMTFSPLNLLSYTCLSTTPAPSSFPKLLPSTFSTQDCKLFNAGCCPSSFRKSCWESP